MSNYWERRAVWDLYKNLDDAEATADLIAKVYRSASMNLTYAAKDIFEKYMTKHKLSETEARRLLDTLQDNTSLDELLQTLKNKDYSEKTKQELVQELEAPAYRARLERLQDVMQQVDKLMENVYHQEQQFDTSFLRDLGEKAYYQSIYNVQKRTGLGFSFSHISQKQIDQVLRMNWSGKHYSKRIWKNTENLVQTLKEEMLVSLLTGRTDRETAQIIENKFGAGAIQARRLVRTESCFVAGELTARAYEECGVEKYRYLATLDLRTSKICRSLDGKVFPLSERLVGKNYPPMHPWCRSTTISIIDEETLARMKKRAYNPGTGRIELIPANMTYDQWYEKYVKGNAKAEAQEKAIKNSSSDREQYERYQKVLGKTVPKSFADFQDMKYNEPEMWRFMKLDYQRRSELLEHPELKLPNAEKAILPEPKFTKYLFDENSKSGYPKGRAFTDRLGYGMDNWQKLQKALKNGAPRYPAQYVDNNGYGDRYVQKMVLYGEKGTPANVIVAWLKNADGTTKLTSAYIKEAK